jgi:hypothetical protein
MYRRPQGPEHDLERTVAVKAVAGVAGRRDPPVTRGR